VKEQALSVWPPSNLAVPKVFVDVLAGLIMEGCVLSEDEEYRRKPSTRAVDPISRTLLATAEGHQDYVDKAQFFYLYMVNPYVDLAICIACLFPPLVSWWFLGGIMAVLVVLVEASLVLATFWLAWRAAQRDKSVAASRTR